MNNIYQATRRARKDPYLRMFILQQSYALAKSPVRSALPKKKQRELGMLPKL
jgi:hypothetical protein